VYFFDRQNRVTLASTRAPTCKGTCFFKTSQWQRMPFALALSMALSRAAGSMQLEE